MRTPERGRRSGYSVLVMVLVLVLVAAACGGEPGSIGRDFDLNERRVTERGGGDTTRFVVGSKDFPEQEVLGHIAIAALRAGGAEVVDRTGLGGTEDVREALVDGDIHMYWEYTGTGWLSLLAEAPVSDPGQLYPQLATSDRERNGIAWLPPAPADNTYAIAVREEVGIAGHPAHDPDLAAVQTISDLAALAREQPETATLCVGPEFSERADGLPGLAEHYGLAIPPQNVSELADSTVYGAVDKGERCTFGSVFATSGLIPELGLRLLVDDQDFFAPYNPSVTMRQETLDRYPELTELFSRISPRLDTATMRDLNARVEVDDRSPADVAEAWLHGHGLL